MFLKFLDKYKNISNNIQITKSLLTDEEKTQIIGNLGESANTLDGTVSSINTAINTIDFVSERVKFKCVVLDKTINTNVLIHRIKKVIKRIETVIDVLDISVPFSICLIPLTHKRYLPDKTVSATNINGGFTYAGTGNIYIYRLEEFAKVILHEVIHNSKLHIHNWTIENNSQLYELFNVDKSARLEQNEAIVEVWAEIFHCAFICLENGFDDTYFKNMMYIETEWVRSRVEKLLCLYEMCPIKQGLHGSLIKNNDNNKWFDETHAFSYVIVRGAILQFLNEFLKLYTSKVEPTSDILTQFIIQVYKKADFKKPFKDITLTKSDDDISLRMTWFGNL